MYKLFFALLLLTACHPNVVINAEPVPCTMNVQRVDVADVDWARQAIHEAVDFWSTKGVCFEESPVNSDVRVEVEDLDFTLVGIYYPDEALVQLNSKLYINPSQAACTAAHELGHHIGLEHTSIQDGVMYPKISFTRGCVWTEADEAEFQRALAEGPLDE